MKLFDVYPLFDVNIVKGKGCKVWDENGQERECLETCLVHQRTYPRALL